LKRDEFEEENFIVKHEYDNDYHIIDLLIIFIYILLFYEKKTIETTTDFTNDLVLILIQLNSLM